MRMRAFYWANEDTRVGLNRKYFKDEVEDRVRQIGERVEELTGIEGFADKFFDYMGQGFYSLSTPIWTNFGRNGLPISCNNSYIPDSISGIFDKLAEIAAMTKLGAGTSAWMGDIRPMGAPITTGGKADGPHHFARLFNTAIDVVSQGDTRRGNIALYNSVAHPDIGEWLRFREESSEIQNVSFGVTITDEWMEQMFAGDREKQGVMAKIIERRYESGYPYIVFHDTVNRNKPDVYRDKDMVINGSNLCVSGDTKILTRSGHQEIAGLVDSMVQVWNGEEWSEVEVRLTGRNQKLVRVQLSDGRYLDCTPYHKFYLSNGSEVRAGELQVGDPLIKFTLPLIEGHKTLSRAYTNGFFTGDGCDVGGRSRIYLYGEKRRLKPFIEHNGSWYVQEDQGRELTWAEGLEPKFFVPDSSYTVESRLTWLAGLLDSDGTVARNGHNESLQIGSINLKFLKEVQDMLQTLGVNAKVTQAHGGGDRSLPGGVYTCQTFYRLLINSNDTQYLRYLGLQCHRLDLHHFDPQRSAAHFARVVSVTDLPGEHDTFCFSEPKRHMGVFNGILTGQCSEIFQPSTEDESFVCCLSSMNLARYDTWKNTDAVEVIVTLLDAVMTEYIEKTANIPHMEAPRRFAIRHRAIGLGSLGLHTALQEKRLAFGSFEARQYDGEMHQLISEQALAASQKLAKMFGEPELLEGYGRRNTTLMAIAPTTSSSFILGQVSPSIEPLMFNYGTLNVAFGKFSWRNPVLKRLLEEKGQDNEEIWNQILIDGGSVRNVACLTPEEKKVFATFAEIPSKDVLNHAAYRQRFIDQGQSINLMIHPMTPARDTLELIRYAWENGIKSLYYQRGKNLAQELVVDQLHCSMCEG